MRAVGEYRGKQELFRRQTPEVLASLRELAIIESSESSNRLEGITAPRERVRALVVQGTIPRDRSEQEIAGYRDVLAQIHDSAEGMAFSVNVVLQLHQMLYRHVPSDGGRWKMTQNEIVERNADGTLRRVRFTPVAPVATPAAMDALVHLYAVALDRGRDPLVIVPLTVLDFLCIHPFLDGNGRTARLLTLLLLYHAGYEVGRYISLERIFEESKESYYETLEKSSRGWHDAEHDVLPWITYFWGVLLRAYREFEERVGTLQTSRGAKARMIERVVERQIGAFSISDIEEQCPGVSRDWLRVVLRRLRDEGTIAPRGRGRSAKWVRLDG
jgi:Fic family protein